MEVVTDFVVKIAFPEPRFDFEDGYSQDFLIFCPVLALRPFFLSGGGGGRPQCPKAHILTHIS